MLVTAILVFDAGTAGSGANSCGRITAVLCVECCATMGCAVRLAYLGVINTFALRRLPPMNDHAKDAEILALRHQILVLQRHMQGDRVRFTRTDQVWLAALLHPLPRGVLNHLQLLVRPHAVGRPRMIRSIRRLVLRLAREMDLEDTGCQMKYLIQDRDCK